MRPPTSLISALFGSALLAACATATAPQAASLDGTAWVLATLGGNAVLPGDPPTVRFFGDRVHGSDGCNIYGGSYTAAQARLRLGDDLIGTKKACAPAVMAQADAFIDALRGGHRYERQGESLHLVDAAGRTVARLAAQRATLAGSAWEVTAYNNGREAVVSLIEGSRLSAEFGADGRLSGSAGCNAYRASYEAAAGELRIGPAAATFKACAQPAGVMEQEQAYLRALATVARYRLDGTRLELRSADGALAVTLRAASAPGAGPIAMRCGDRTITVEEAGEEAVLLTVGDETLRLHPVPAASGARYAADGDPTTSFWSKGARASVEFRGQPLPECVRVEPARQ